MDEGALVIAEERPEGILIRPAVAMATETYSLERKASFLLENAVGVDDYPAVRAMGSIRLALRTPRHVESARRGRDDCSATR